MHTPPHVTPRTPSLSSLPPVSELYYFFVTGFIKRKKLEVCRTVGWLHQYAAGVTGDTGLSCELIATVATVMQSDPAYLTSFRYLVTMPIVSKVLGIFGKRFRLPMFIVCNGLYGLLTVCVLKKKVTPPTKHHALAMDGMVETDRNTLLDPLRRCCLPTSTGGTTTSRWPCWSSC
jgi:hypothetical protein